MTTQGNTAYANQEQIYESLMESIVTFEYMPGEMISENMLAEKFRTSRTTIRAVLQRLERDILVDIIPQKGSFVAYLNYDYILSILFIRFTVEYKIMSELMEAYTPEIEEKLLAILADYESVEQRDYYDYFAYDSDFHRTIYAAVRDKWYWENVERLDATCKRSRMLIYQHAKQSPHEFRTRHLQLLESVKSQDKQQMHDVLHDHIYGNVHQLKDILGADWPAYFVS